MKTPPPLRPYQVSTVERLRESSRLALLVDMGLGKTATVLTALEPRHLPVLVVAPKRVAENVWPTEVGMWRPDLKVAVAAGRKELREAALKDTSADIVVIGRDNLGDAVPHAKRFKTFVLDELSSFRSPRAARTKHAAKIALGGMPYVWGMTGSPRPKSLMDLYAQFHILDGGLRLGRSLTGFRSQFFSPGRQLPSGVITDWIPNPGAAEIIYKDIADIAVTLTTEGRVSLPEKIYNPIVVPLEPEVRKIYQDMKRDYVVSAGGDTVAASNAAVKSQKLEQISSGFLYTDDTQGPNRPYKVLSRAKIAALEEIIEGTGSPVMVAYRNIAELKMLKEAFGAAVYTPDSPLFVERWNAGELPILAAHPGSIGHGLNLQFGGHTVVWLNLPWDLEQWEQFNKRLHRSGQDHPVTIHYMVSPRTVDEVKRAVVLDRADQQEEMKRHLETPF